MKKIIAVASAAVLALPLLAANVKFAYGTLTVTKADDASLEKACLEYPDAKQISVSGAAITSDNIVGLAAGIGRTVCDITGALMTFK